jgi:hypothetical protein
MEQSPFREADSHSASQEIPNLLWNPKVQCYVHKSSYCSLSWANESSPQIRTLFP